MCSKKEIKPPCGLPYGSLPCTFNSRKDALSSSGRTNSQTEPPVLVICLHNMLPLFKVSYNVPASSMTKQEWWMVVPQPLPSPPPPFFLTILEIYANGLGTYFYAGLSIFR